jgi:maleylpyruvate isomerase
MYNARRFGVDVSAYPRLVAACAHLETLPAFVVARPENQPDAERK